MDWIKIRGLDEMVLNIFDLITRDHKKILKSLGDLELTTNQTPTTRSATWALAKNILLPHLQSEEEVFYPELKKSIENEILKAVKDHNLIKAAAKDMEATPPDEDLWLEKLKIVKENMQHHIDDEEGEIFDSAKKSFSARDIEDIGRRFQRAKEGVSRNL